MATLGLGVLHNSILGPCLQNGFAEVSIGWVECWPTSKGLSSLSCGPKHHCQPCERPWSSGSGPGMAVGHGEMAKAGWGRLAGKRVKDVELDCYSILQLIHDYIVIVFHNHCFHMFRFMNHTSCIHTLSFFPYIASSLPKVASFNSCWFAALGVDLAKWSKAEPNQNPAKHAVGQTCGNSAHVSIVPIDLWNTYHSSMSAAASASFFFFLKLFSSALSWTKSSMNSIYIWYMHAWI